MSDLQKIQVRHGKKINFYNKISSVSKYCCKFVLLNIDWRQFRNDYA